MCPNLKNNEYLPVDRREVSSSSAPEWTRQAWMGFTSVSRSMDACTLESALYAALKMNVGINWYNESYASLCHNVTQVVTWPITSYGGAAEKSPAPRAPINRFGKKNSFHFNIEIEKPTHWFNFWTSVILSVTLRAESPSIFLDKSQGTYQYCLISNREGLGTSL